MGTVVIVPAAVELSDEEITVAVSLDVCHCDDRPMTDREKITEYAMSKAADLLPWTSDVRRALERVRYDTQMSRWRRLYGKKPIHGQDGWRRPSPPSYPPECGRARRMPGVTFGPEEY